MVRVEFPNIRRGFFWDKILRQNRYPRTKISIRENSGYDFHFLLPGLPKTRFVIVVFNVIGQRYGDGVYFARDASYSRRYTGGAGGGGAMYLARVLVGEYCQGYSGLVIPPPKDRRNDNILYDSVVDRTPNATIFVVFNDAQCYPEYIIRF